MDVADVAMLQMLIFHVSRRCFDAGSASRRSMMHLRDASGKMLYPFGVIDVNDVVSMPQCIDLLDVIDVNDIAMMPMQLMKWVCDDVLYVPCTDVLDVVCAINCLDALNLDDVHVPDVGCVDDVVVVLNDDRIEVN